MKLHLEYDLNEDPGEGNLNLRAYIASVLGPKRAAHGARSEKQVRFDRGTLIAKNAPGGKQHQCLYVQCWMPGKKVGDLIDQTSGFFRFSSDENMGATSVMVQVFPNELFTYSAVLLPNEQLYAQALQSFSPPFFPNALPLIISTVAF